nr:flagellin [uncultured Oscillibacter sp.]
MRIQHNIMAMNAYRNYNTNTSALAKNLEKLSSGYKINRAGDDAAGLAISEKMRAQITGLNAAQKNVKDGISLVKTAEGAMQEIQDMLNRMDYLATQSANGTYDDPVDRANLQKEVDALRKEIDRIADSANFNGINLLDGTQSAKKVKTADAVAAPDPAIDASSIEAATKKDGQHPSSATKAEITIKLGAAADKLDLGGTGTANVTPGTTTGTALLGLASGIGAGKLSDIFDLKDADGNDVTLGDALDENTTYKLVAKTAGALSQDVLDAVTAAAAGGSSVSVVNGKDEGAAPDGTKAKYSLTFDFENLAGGQKFEIGDKKFEISTSGTATTGYTAIDLSGIALDIEGDKNGVGGKTASTGRNLAIEKIQDVISTAFGTDFDVDAAPDTSIGTDTTYTINFEAKNAETAAKSYNLGDVRVSETDKTDIYAGKSGITGTYNPGQLGGDPKPGTFATVTYDKFDLSKLAVGDKVTIYGKTIEVVEKAEDADPNGGKLVLDDAKDAGKFIAAFERMFRDEAQGGNQQQNFGKLTITGSKLTVIDAQDVGRTADQLIADVGLKFEAANPGAAKDAEYKTTGGLTLQIGDTSKSYNQLSVSIGDMHVSAMGTNYTTQTVDGEEKRVDNLDADGNVAVISGKSIADIKINTQTGAQDAIDVIRDAINYVSSIRGDLGAVQNRLEHTANNLSVMAENIQDAESTIRDTDVAEEMMAYTKNNILVQSAQAMLAQANAVPQGVLQLLG